MSTNPEDAIKLTRNLFARIAEQSHLSIQKMQKIRKKNAETPTRNQIRELRPLLSQTDQKQA